MRESFDNNDPAVEGKKDTRPSRRDFFKRAVEIAGLATIASVIPKSLSEEDPIPAPAPRIESKKPVLTKEGIIEHFKGKYRVSSFEEMEKLKKNDKSEHSFLEVAAGSERVLFHLGKGTYWGAIEVDIEKLSLELPAGVTDITLWHTHPLDLDEVKETFGLAPVYLIKSGSGAMFPKPFSHYDLELSLSDKIRLQKNRPEVKLKDGIQDGSGRWTLEIDEDSRLNADLYKEFNDLRTSFQKSVTVAEKAMLERLRVVDSTTGDKADEERKRIRNSELYKNYVKKADNFKHSPNYDYMIAFMIDAVFERIPILNAWEKDFYSIGSNTKKAIGNFIKSYKEKYKVTITYQIGNELIK